MAIYAAESISGILPIQMKTSKSDIRLHRTTVDIDLDAYERAREVLGTNGYKETVNAALRKIARQRELEDLADWIRRGEFRTPSLEELRRMRKPRA